MLDCTNIIRRLMKEAYAQGLRHYEVEEYIHDNLTEVMFGAKSELSPDDAIFC